MARFDLMDAEWAVIEPLLPTDVRSKERVEDRRVLNRIFWQLRTGAPWADIPKCYGPHTTCSNRLRRWRKRGMCRTRSAPCARPEQTRAARAVATGHDRHPRSETPWP